MYQILSLDDNRDFLELYNVALEMQGYRHRYTTNGRDALSILSQEPIDLFTQDLLRPVMNGFQLYWLMKSKQELRDIPILIISAWRPVEVTQATLVGRAQKCLLRARFKAIHEVHHEAISAADHVENANALYVEGFLPQPLDIQQFLSAIQLILEEGGKASLTEEERALQHQQLWALATRKFDLTGEGLKALRQWDKSIQARWRVKLARAGD